MPPPVRWSLLLSVPEAASRSIELAPGELYTLEPHATVQVNERGAADVSTPTVQVLVPPHLVAGRPPEQLGRWRLAFELALPTRTQAFTFTRATGEVFSMGRHDQNVLRLPTESLARKHVGFFVDSGGQLWATDLASPNGTWRGQEQLAGWTALAPGETLRAGQVLVRLTGCEAASSR